MLSTTIITGKKVNISYFMFVGIKIMICKPLFHEALYWFLIGHLYKYHERIIISLGSVKARQGINDSDYTARKSHRDFSANESCLRGMAPRAKHCNYSGNV